MHRELDQLSRDLEQMARDLERDLQGIKGFNVTIRSDEVTPKSTRTKHVTQKEVADAIVQISIGGRNNVQCKADSVNVKKVRHSTSALRKDVTILAGKAGKCITGLSVFKKAKAWFKVEADEFMEDLKNVKEGKNKDNGA